MTFRFAIIDSVAASKVKFVNKAGTKERWSFVFKCKKVIDFTLSLENKPEVTEREFIFHYAINSCVYMKRKLT